MNKYFKVTSHAWNEGISKIDILLNFEREIDRWKDIIGYSKEIASEMKLDIHDMINNGEINESTPANKEFVEKLYNKYKTSNIKNLTNDQLYNEYQQAKFNFRNAPEGSKEELEADIIFNELSKEVESREDFNWLEYKTAELEKQKELLQDLINQIEGLEDGGIINLVSLIEDEGMNINNILLMYLYNNIKHLNITTHEIINNIPLSIKVFTR